MKGNMRAVQRSDIIDYQSYQENREIFQREAFAAKSRRRIHLGDCFTFLFENTLTIRYQIQEMMRAEQIVREKDILDELETYNRILGGDGELGCTFFIVIDDTQVRNVKLREWIDLPAHIYVKMEDGTNVYSWFDPDQISDGRLSSVQYLKFQVQDEAPVALGTVLPGCEMEIRLTDDQRSALQEDLEIYSPGR
jgi:hypothetical protein